MTHPEFPFEMSLPPVKRQEPRLWVKELAVYREWKPDAEQQRISLRQGLNIIWAEPSEQGAGGHAAGKTTFCRFLRYLLGDSNFGSDAFREAFRIKFPNALLAVRTGVRAVSLSTVFLMNKLSGKLTPILSARCKKRSFSHCRLIHFLALASQSNGSTCWHG
jgi:hypothetical protein